MFKINGQAASGLSAEAAYIEWCLSLQNERQPVPRTALSAIKDFQEGAFRGNLESRSRLQQAGIDCDLWLPAQALDIIMQWKEALNEAMSAGRQFALFNPINGDRLFFE